MNSEEIISRLKTVLEYYSLTSSTFAESIDVQRSSISHLMSGRNKPSLDFVMKVVDTYPEVDYYWLLKGKGDFPKKEKIEKKVIEESLEEKKEITPSLFNHNYSEKKEEIREDVRITQNVQEEKKISNTQFSANEKKLIKVVLLYNDGSFEEYNK